MKTSKEKLFKPSVYGIGYLGEGLYNTKSYSFWANMLKRCYCISYHTTHPTYKGTIVCEEWHNFQNFTKWFEENWKPWMDKKWQLDKDLLINDNKIYSPETCCFLPNEINILFKSNTNQKNNLPIGVSKTRNKYRARITKFSKEYNLGHYTSIDEAFKVYKKVREDYIEELAKKWKEFLLVGAYEKLKTAKCADLVATTNY